MNRILNVISFMNFASALAVRAVDPIIPQIAIDLAVTPATAALLAVGFAAYGLALPILGPVADTFGKVRIMIVCLAVLALSSLACAAAQDFWLLFVLRVVSGASCGGSFPIAMALISDLVPMEQRQVVIGRLLAGTIAGNLLGAAAAGAVADLVHWRAVFVVLSVIALVALLLAVATLRGIAEAPRQPLNPLTVLRRYRAIFANPTARTCYLTVATEGVFLFGVFAYVAVLLVAAGEPRASIAGLVIAAFAIGGLIYSFSVGALLRWLGQRHVMIGGGLLMGLGMAVVAFAPPWPVQSAAFAAMGLGFYMLHASIQVFVTELAPATRSSAVAFHTFSIFAGQAIGTVAIGLGLAAIGATPTLLIASVALALLGFVSSYLLLRPKSDGPRSIAARGTD